MLNLNLVARLSRWFVAGLLTMFCLAGQAQILDRIDVVSGDEEAQIVVRFAQKILYQRHAPQNEGKIVRIFIRLVDTNLPEGELMQETLRSPKVARVPNVTVVYPELVNGMLVTFSQSTRYNVRPGEDSRSLIITVPLLPPDRSVAKVAVPAKADTTAKASEPPASVPTATGSALPVLAAGSGEAPAAVSAEVPEMPVAPALSPSEVEARSRGFIDEARQALAGKDPALAINRLNRILGLPRNSQTEPAQALIGEAREMNGEYLKAKAEYDLYLKLFPGGPAAPRVKERLAALPKDAAARAAAPKPLPKEAGPAEWTYFGSVSSYYYTGKSQIETLTPPPPGLLTFNRDTLSVTDQNSLITTINLNARRRDAFSDTRIVFRDTDNHNYLRPDRSYNRVYSAYVDHNDRKIGYYVRAGRQNPNGMGVLERFDGVQAGYNLDSQWRINGVYGDAVEFNSPFRKSFYGASIDLLPQTGRPGVSLYGIEQTLDGKLNRRALGVEGRYFDGRATGYGTVDYDVLYKGVNIALLQGNYLDEAGNNYFFVIDHRRAPSYSLTNALVSAPGMTLKDMIDTQGLDVVRQQARHLTALSDMFSVGVTHPLSERWQVGVDYRMSQISSTTPVNAVIPLAVIGTCLGVVDPVNNTCIINTASQQGSGQNHVVTFQAIGNSLFVTNAVGVANLSLISAPTYSGQASSLSYVLPIGDQWRFDTNLRYYTQKSDDGGSQERLSPSIKASWQWRNSLFLEGEMGQETSRSSNVVSRDHITRNYMYMGLRWDFR